MSHTHTQKEHIRNSVVCMNIEQCHKNIIIEYDEYSFWVIELLQTIGFHQNGLWWWCLYTKILKRKKNQPTGCFVIRKKNRISSYDAIHFNSVATDMLSSSLLYSFYLNLTLFQFWHTYGDLYITWRCLVCNGLLLLNCMNYI